MRIEIPIHTLLFTIGPTNCGKSFLTKEVLLPILKSKYPDLIIQYISSDDSRRDILGDCNIHKYDSRMDLVSHQAFEIMYSKMENYMKFPSNANLIIVDSNGL